MIGKLTLSDNWSLNTEIESAIFNAENFTDRVCLYAINDGNFTEIKYDFRKIMLI